MISIDKLKQDVASALGINPSELKDNSGPTNISAWDSLGHLKIVSLLDDYVNDTIDAADAEKIRTFADVVEFCRKRGVV